MNKVLSEDRVIELLQTLDPMPAHRIAKCRTFYQLAKEAPSDTDVVELGTYHGIGAIALAYGARAGNGAKVHTIDAYTTLKGWAGEEYSLNDKDIFEKNRKKAGFDGFSYPWLHVGAFSWWAADWKSIISLLIWDGYVNDAWGEIYPWIVEMLSPGGVIAVHYHPSNAKGCLSVLKNLEDYGYIDRKDYPGDIYAVRDVTPF